MGLRLSLSGLRWSRLRWLSLRRWLNWLRRLRGLILLNRLSLLIRLSILRCSGGFQVLPGLMEFLIKFLARFPELIHTLT